MSSDAVDSLPCLVPPDPQQSQTLGRMVGMTCEMDGSW